ncbi:MAG: hypothetical protein DI617_09245 [Streptococcus pyogenes]|nr:MAG: hypothetical protein DI617_09245 [Streptococcus pyogenes]
MTVFKNVSRIFGANALQRNGRLGDYTNVRDFTLGNIYVSNDNLVSYFSNEPFEAILVTVDGLKSFNTTKYRAYIDAAEYEKTDDSVTGMSSFAGIYVDGRKILSVWSNGHKLYQANVTNMAKITATVWGKPQKVTGYLYFYLREEDTPQRLVNNIDYVTDVLLGDTSIGSDIVIDKSEGFYLFTVKSTISKIALKDYMQVTFIFLRGDK